MSLNITTFSFEDPESDNESLNISDIVLVDKVYTFTQFNPVLRFDDLYFEKFYFYDIKVAVVSPHTCGIKIDLWDPENDLYQISNEENITQGDYRVIPYGTTLSGNYSIQFETDLSENLNVHIIIEQIIKCLYEFIGTSDEKVYYNVSKFSDGDSLAVETIFKTDKYYKVFFQRVSPISIKLSNHVVLDHYILDSRGTLFGIYRNISLGYNNYYFGTAIEGLYTINISIYCDVPSVNIAFAIIEREGIGDIMEPLPPEPTTDDNMTDHTQSSVRYYIPKEWTIGVFVFIGMSIGIPVMLTIHRRKKNSMKL